MAKAYATPWRPLPKQKELLLYLLHWPGILLDDEAIKPESEEVELR